MMALESYMIDRMLNMQINSDHFVTGTGSCEVIKLRFISTDDGLVLVGSYRIKDEINA